jgi:HEPN domain-containing protein
MCHLSIEKALKGLYSQKFSEIPPRTHSFTFLVEKMGMKLPGDLYDFLFIINRMSVPTRYPDDPQKALRDFTRKRTQNILRKSEALLEWLKEQLPMLSDS